MTKVMCTSSRFWFIEFFYLDSAIGLFLVSLLNAFFCGALDLTQTGHYSNFISADFEIIKSVFWIGTFFCLCNNLLILLFHLKDRLYLREGFRALLLAVVVIAFCLLGNSVAYSMTSDLNDFHSGKLTVYNALLVFALGNSFGALLSNLLFLTVLSKLRQVVFGHYLTMGSMSLHAQGFFSGVLMGVLIFLVWNLLLSFQLSVWAVLLCNVFSLFLFGIVVYSNNLFAKIHWL